MIWLFLILPFLNPPMAVGPVIEDCQKDGVAFQAGLLPGDILHAWRRENGICGASGAEGVFKSMSDLNLVENTQTARGEVTLILQRGKEIKEVKMPPGDWRLKVRPAYSPENKALYEQGLGFLQQGKIKKGVSFWILLAEKESDPDRAAWLYSNIADKLASAELFEEANSYYDKVLENTGTPIESARALLQQGDGYRMFNQFPQANSCYSGALTILEEQHADPLLKSEVLGSFTTGKARFGDMEGAVALAAQEYQILAQDAPFSMDIARNLMRQGVLAWIKGDLALAKKVHLQAAEIQRALNPITMDYAGCIENLGLITADQGNHDLALNLAHEALEIIKELKPQSAVHGRSLYNLGSYAEDAGELFKAENYYQQALTLFENAGIEPLERAAILTSLGELAMLKGDYLAAESYGWKALGIKKKLAPESRDVYKSIMFLGRIAWAMHDDERAENEFSLALEMIERIAPNSLEHADALGALGKIFSKKGMWNEAETDFKMALTIQEAQAPESIWVSTSLMNLGKLAMDRNDLPQAESFYKKALQMRQTLAPNSLALATSLSSLGECAFTQKSYKKADELFQQSLAIREKLAPGSILEARSLFSLADTWMQLGKENTALLERGLAALEEQIGRFGGTQELQSGYIAQFQEKYWELTLSHFNKGRMEDAFYAYERGRAQILRRIMAEKESQHNHNIPVNLSRNLELNAMNYEKTQNQIADLHPVKDEEAINQLIHELKTIREKRQRIKNHIAELSSKTVRTGQSKVIHSKEFQKTLDYGTLFLSYAVGDSQTLLFAVSKPGEEDASGFQVIRIPYGRMALEDLGKGFRKWLMRPTTNTHQEFGKTLYQTLITPVQSLLDSSQRVLICPDGPLRGLPFEAFFRGQHPDDYLIIQKPIHTVVSATIYAGLVQERTSPKPIRLVAIGNPIYPTGELGESSTQNSFFKPYLKRNKFLEPLPGARKELEAIADIFGEASNVYMGESATEEIAKTISGQATHLHFACHGILDEQSPLDSALALSTPTKWSVNRENGLLQAWEIMEELTLKTELVVLSACDSGLGAAIGGEGFLGLTRAFQYAGARSIVASFWQVSDLSTAPFMVQFYKYLKEGKTKDLALRKVQLDMIQQRILPTENGEVSGGKDYVHPYFWAPFQLIGDWR